MLEFSVHRYRREITDFLMKLLAIPSVKSEPHNMMPFGKDIFSALIRTLDLADNLDLENVNLFSYIGYAKYGQSDKQIAILTHLDVVPAEDWPEAFTPKLEDGVIYARGAVDNKAAAVAALFALVALRDNCVHLDKEVRVIFGCDEESGFSDIEFYKQHEKEPDYVIVPDSGFPIYNAEKGILHIRLTAPITEAGNIAEIASGNVVNKVPGEAVGVLALCEDEVCARLAEVQDINFSAENFNGGTKLIVCGKSAHGSTPEEGVNALVGLLVALEKLPLTGSIADFCRVLAREIGTGYLGEGLGIACEDWSGKLTASPSTLLIEGDNVVALIDIRVPVELSCQEIYDKISDRFTPLGITVDTTALKEPHWVSEDSELVCALMQAYEEVFNTPAECRPSAGGTYARAFPSGVAFGPVHDKCGEHGIHSHDEHISVDEVMKLTEALCSAFCILGNAKSLRDE